MPKAPKPSDPLMAGHPTEIIPKSQPTSHGYNSNPFHFAENRTKPWERAGTALVQNDTKNPLHMFQHQASTIYSAFQSGNCSVVMLSDCTFQSSRSVFLPAGAVALNQVLHQGTNTFPQTQLCNRTPTSSIISLTDLTDLWDSEMRINYSQTSPC